jgi:putative molybdopterin biosynthesis protein
LIKKGELPAYRVGRQMRVDASDLEAYKHRSKGGHVPVKATLAAPSHAEREPGGPGKSSMLRPVIISGQDICLDLLANHIEKKQIGIRPLRTHTGSLNSLISMFLGESDVVSTHLLAADTNEYNLPYIRKLLVSQSYLVVHVMSRWAGLYVQKGNPKKLHAWDDLQRTGIRLVNREKGSGARVLLDEQLRIHGLSRRQIEGYDHEESSHLGVASVIASGQADIGVGIEKAARLAGIDFIPLIQESYDLVLLKTPENRLLIQTVLDILQSSGFQQEIFSLGGYEIARMGTIVFETD